MKGSYLANIILFGLILGQLWRLKRQSVNIVAKILNLKNECSLSESKSHGRNLNGTVQTTQTQKLLLRIKIRPTSGCHTLFLSKLVK